jgi:carbamoyl-phosphate synthase large subunit
LRKQEEFDVCIVGADINEESDIAGSHFCDKFFQVPFADEGHDYIGTLVDIINSQSIDLVIPIVDIELEVIAQNSSIIGKSTCLVLSSYDTVMICNDKFRTYEFFNRSDIPALKTVLVGDFGDITKLITDSNIDFPFIAKPRKGVSSRDVYEIRSGEELFLIKAIKDAVIQEKGEGQEYTIDIFCDEGKLISAVPRERIETRAGISYKGQTSQDDKLISYVEKMGTELKIKGPANIQCFKNGDDVKFFEINPRFSGSLPLTTAAGVNTPLFALKMAARQELEPIEDFKIIKMCRYWEEVFYEK